MFKTAPTGVVLNTPGVALNTPGGTLNYLWEREIISD